MGQAQSAMADFTVGEIGHSAFTALGDDELRRWEVTCRGLEAAEVHPWADAEARTLMDTVLACLFGADLARLDVPARDWARTTRTMAIFARRLGCLRELISQESLLNGPESSDRVQEIFDRVTVVGTEVALAALVGTAATTAPAAPPATPDAVPASAHDAVPLDGHDAGAAPDDVGPDGARRQSDEPTAASLAAGAPEGEPADDVDDPAPDTEEAGARRRRRGVGILLGVAAALLAAGVAVALASSPAPRHDARHGGPGTGRTASHAPGGGTTHASSALGSSIRPPTSGGAGASGGSGSTPRSGGPVEKGPASGRRPAGGSGSQGAAGPGSSGSGAGAGAGTTGTGGASGTGGQSGTRTLDLPGVGSLTVPEVTVPGGTQVTTPPASVPSQQVEVPGGGGVTLPGLTVPSL